MGGLPDRSGILERVTQEKLRIFLCVLLVMVAAGSAVAAPENAHVALGGRELPLVPLPVLDDGAVYAPVKVLDYMDCKYDIEEEDHSVTITSEDGSRTRISTVASGTTEMLPMVKVAEAVDGEAVWNESTRTLNILSRLKSVEFVDGRLHIYLSLPAAHRICFWPNPDRIAVDVIGARLDAPAGEVFIGTADVQRARLGQFDDQTARVVLDLSRRIGYRTISPPISRHIEIETGASLPKPEASPEPPPKPKVLTVSAVSAESIDVNTLRLKLSSDGKPDWDWRLLEDPLRLCIDIPGAKLQAAQEAEPVDHPLARLLRTGQQDGGKPSVRIVLELTRHVAVSGVSSDATGLVIDVRLPQGAGGKLAEKTIVIDPGHGGAQKGTCFGNIYEKNLNLQIAKRVARRLEEIGAKAILTRDGDNNLHSSRPEDLKKRPEVATRAGADLFVSIHCNAIGVPDRLSGTETYHRYSKPDSYALACAVHDEIIKGTGMKDRGVRPDSKLHGAMGLAVLRYSTVPAILVEAGYLDHSSDRRKLVDPAFQEKFAAALVEGLRIYVEGGEP